MNNTPTSPDCCDSWPLLRSSFEWFECKDNPSILVMPSITISDGDWMRVNYCPVCGGSRRAVIWNQSTHPEVTA